MRSLGVAAVLALLATPAALAQSALPDPARTPGALNPEVTQATIGTTICVRGWTQTVRPPQAYTHLSGSKSGSSAMPIVTSARTRRTTSCRWGSEARPCDPRNLWPEPRATAGGWNADVKDDLEAVLSRLVGSGRVPLAGTQQAISTDWTAAYNRFVVGR
jgi:hypothetical protein